MKATEAKLLEFIKKSPQFLIPIYQRTYSWTEKECRQLWDDIVCCGKNDKITAHFIGSVVYVEQGLYSVTSQSPLLIIDGQQRITTITLLIAALSEIIDDNEPFDGFTKKKLRNYYLFNPEEDGEKYYKLILSKTDKQSLIAILDDTEQPQSKSLRVTENFNLFKEWLTKQGDLSVICKGLVKLMVVDIALSREQDNPQLIFESMNSTGKELSQADLIRNYILMGLEPGLQTRLYEKYWYPMELDFGQEAYSSHFDGFMRHFLTVKTGVISKIGEVYEGFKHYAVSSDMSGASVESLVSDIRDYAKYYCSLALGAEQNTELKQAFHDLRELKVDVSYPFLLELYCDYTNDILSKDDLVSAVRLVESYVFRRAVCAIPTNSMNKTFANLTKSLKKDRYIESIRAALQLLPSYRRFPGNDEFRRELKTKDLYNFRSRSYWLRRLENFDRKERVLVDDYTIEHIMPQCDNKPEKVTKEWRTELGEDWERVWETYRHTLGNLTLTGYNSEYSNHSFKKKRDMEGGFSQSPLKLNNQLAAVHEWNEKSIKERADNLAEIASKVWLPAHLEAEILEAYRPETADVTQYSIEDHPYLASGQIKIVFEAFRKEVKAIDPCVSEEFLKLYVAFKAETNFVDVVPQAKRLRLSLNMSFQEIDDPRGLCKDVTNLGRWGNGDVETSLSALEELPHVMALVRQAFETQMSDTIGN